MVSHSIDSLKYAGMEQDIREIVVPAYGRQIHDLEGNERFRL